MDKIFFFFFKDFWFDPSSSSPRVPRGHRYKKNSREKNLYMGNKHQILYFAYQSSKDFPYQ